jgi:hypothetical protein
MPGAGTANPARARNAENCSDRHFKPLEMINTLSA